jgi:cbb3-type cytochrome oxidase subunit 3
MAIFLVVVALCVRPGAKSRAVEAARIPLDDDTTLRGDRQ